MPQALRRVEQVIDLPEQDKQCECGHRLVRIGEDTSEKLDVIPPQVRAIRTVRPRYACHHCEGSGDEEHPAVRVAPPPLALIPKGLASEGLLAFIATAKFCDALPWCCRFFWLWWLFRRNFLRRWWHGRPCCMTPIWPRRSSTAFSNAVD